MGQPKFGFLLQYPEHNNVKAQSLANQKSVVIIEWNFRNFRFQYFRIDIVLIINNSPNAPCLFMIPFDSQSNT